MIYAQAKTCFIPKAYRLVMFDALQIQLIYLKYYWRFTITIVDSKLWFLQSVFYVLQFTKKKAFMGNENIKFPLWMKKKSIGI